LWTTFRSTSGRSGHLRTDLSIQYSQRFANHPQIRQREQRVQLRSVAGHGMAARFMQAMHLLWTEA
jgi:hypothetical protein